MEQTQETRLTKQVQINIDLAEQALSNDKLDEAQGYFNDALQVEGEHPERVPRIRQILKDYSDELAGRASPDWGKAHQALEIINALNLPNEQTQAWQRELKLVEASYWLDRNDLDQSFAIFRELINQTEGSKLQSELRLNISHLVRDHVKQGVPEQRWFIIRDVIERLKALLAPTEDSLFPTDEIHSWLEIISQILIPVSEQEQIQRRYRNLNYGLGALIAVLLIVAYVLL